MNLSIGFSPCPNDTFIFHALLHDLVATPDLSFQAQIEDVETLNQLLVSGKGPEVCKVSMGAYAFIEDEYEILHAGAALGFDCGPLLISHVPKAFEPDDIKKQHILIPGKLTTANFLLHFALHDSPPVKAVVFSEIESRLKNKECEYGVIIHENRFTYEQNGLHKVLDLGSYWQEQTSLPIPLGVIAVKRSLDFNIKKQVNDSIRKSIEYAFKTPSASLAFRTLHSADMNEEVMQQHIQLYVNEYSLDLGDLGKNCIEYFLKTGEKLNILPKLKHNPFLAV